MDIEKEANDGLRPEQKEILDRLVRRFFVDGERCLLVKAPTGVGKTRIVLEFVMSFGAVGVGAGFWSSSLGGFSPTTLGKRR
jgi:cell division ATPase FtsA